MNKSEDKTENIFSLFLIPWRPDNAIKAIDAGIDLLSGSYPHVLTQRGDASVFTCKYEIDEQQQDGEEEDQDQPAKKRRKVSESDKIPTTLNLHDIK